MSTKEIEETVSKEDIKTLISLNNDISKIRKSRNFINSLTDEEFKIILENSNLEEPLNSLKLKQKIE
jgi:hypothetical protein